MAEQRPAARIILPDPHEKQAVFLDWEHDHPEAQVLVAPCGTKVGKSFGCALWQVGTNLSLPGQYGVWCAPTLFKARVGYRYMKAMLPAENEHFTAKDGALEIWLGNGSFLKFLHGRDAETTVEGEAVDNFVIDEAGKQTQQLWYSTLTTVTQTEGKGIVTGTPRGRGWYYDLFRKAQSGDPMLAWAKLATIDSPFVNPAAVERARRILPDALFRQYYLAEFVSDSTVYGSLDAVWDDSLSIQKDAFWVHPDASARELSVVIGVDLAKRRDYTVFAALNAKGQTVGYLRMRQRTYQDQAQALAKFSSFFPGEDNEVRYDRTGVGDAVGEVISDVFDRVKGDWSISPVVFTNASKQEMVSRVTYAVETGWWRCPRIARVEHEFTALEVAVSKGGLHTYAAPGGDHDDAHWAFALAISGAHGAVVRGSQLDMIEAAMSGKLLTSDEEQEEDEDDPLPDGGDDGFSDLYDEEDDAGDALADAGEMN